MRIALCHHRLTLTGGVEKYLLRLIRSLTGRGHAVSFVGTRADFDLPGLRFHTVPDLQFPRSLRPLAFSLQARAVVRSLQVDVVHSFGKTIECDVYSDGNGLESRFRQYRVSRSSRWTKPFRRCSPVSHASELVEKMRYSAGRLKRVICKARFVYRDLARKYPYLQDRLEVLYNGVEVPCSEPALDPPALRRELGLPLRGRLFAFAGNDFHRKNLDTCLRAVARNGFRLLVAGCDPNPERYRRLANRLGIGDRVYFVGFRHDISRIFHACDGLLAPSRWDVFPNVVLEALACGKPVVVSRSSGSSEIICDGREGIILEDCESEVELAEAIERLKEVSPIEYERRAKLKAREFEWSGHVNKLLELYQSIHQPLAGVGSNAN